MKDKLSALLDGDLDEQSMRPVLDALGRDPALRADWDAYCTIGDVLRREGAAAPDLVGRVMAQIEAEPTLLAPQRRREPVVSAAPWRALMPLAASVMGVAAVGWVANSLYSESAQPVQAVATVEPMRVPDNASLRPVVVTIDAEDPHREYVFAHQAMTGGGPIPGAVQYVRTVSFAGEDGRR